MPINSISNSGAKLLDILDVDYYAMKSGHKESFSERTYNLKVINSSDALVERKVSLVLFWLNKRDHVLLCCLALS